MLHGAEAWRLECGQRHGERYVPGVEQRRTGERQQEQEQEQEEEEPWPGWWVLLGCAGAFARGRAARRAAVGWRGSGLASGAGERELSQRGKARERLGKVKREEGTYILTLSALRLADCCQAAGVGYGGRRRDG
jgi:hypothetical protein